MKNFKNYFDKIFCINYVESADRRNCIIKQLQELQLLNGVEFVFGMPFGKIKSLEEPLAEVVKRGSIYSNVNGFGCAFSHYTAIKSAYELGANSVLIFEDDSSFLKDRNVIIDYLDNMPNDWEFIYFTPASYVRNENDFLKCINPETKYVDLKSFYVGALHWDENYLLADGFVSSCAYALNRKGMDFYIYMYENARYIKNSDAIEYFFNNTLQSPLKSYTTNIRLFAQMHEIDKPVLVDGHLNMEYTKELPLQANVTKDNFYYFEESNNSIIRINEKDER